LPAACREITPAATLHVRGGRLKEEIKRNIRWSDSYSFVCRLAVARVHELACMDVGGLAYADDHHVRGSDDKSCYGYS